MRRARSPHTPLHAAVVSVVLLAAAACAPADSADEAEDVPGPAEVVDPDEVVEPDEATPAGGTTGELLVFSADTSALPKSRLTMESFAENACGFATAEEMAAFLGLDLTPLTAESEAGNLHGTECHYGLGDEEVMVDIRFDQLSRGSGTEEIGLAGAAGVLRTVTASTLENSARVQVPMTLEGTAANALEVVIRSRYRGLEADRESLTAAVDALTTNLIDRLMLVP